MTEVFENWTAYDDWLIENYNRNNKMIEELANLIEMENIRKKN